MTLYDWANDHYWSLYVLALVALAVVASFSRPEK